MAAGTCKRIGCESAANEEMGQMLDFERHTDARLDRRQTMDRMIDSA
jgi:hypothetical protein